MRNTGNCCVCGKQIRTYYSRTCSLICRGKRRLAQKYSLEQPQAVHGAMWIPLTVGKFVLVDCVWYNRLVEMGSWFFHKVAKTGTGYACMRRRRQGRSEPLIFLHRVVMSAEQGQGVDHKDGNTLDCRMGNLRFADARQNNANRRKHSSSVRKLRSRFKGVCQPADYRKWQAIITINDQSIRLGTFETEIEAAQAYDRAARKAFGEFACLNFPRVGERPALGQR